MIISISGKAGSGKDTAGKVIQYLIWKQGLEKLYLPKTLELNKEQSLKTWIETGHIQGWGDINGRHSGLTIKKWADPLRKVAAILLGMDVEFLYTDEFKQMVLPECWNYAYCSHCNWIGSIDSLEFTDAELTTYGHNVHSCPNCSESVRLASVMKGREFLQRLGTDAIRNQLHEQSWVNALMSEYKDVLIKQTDVGYGDRGQYNIPPVYGKPNWIITDTRFPNELSAVKKAGGITIKMNRIAASAAASTHESEIALDNESFDYEIINDGTIEDLAQKLLPIISNLNSNGYNSTARG